MPDLIGRLTDRRSRDAETDTGTDGDTTGDRTPDTLERRRLLTVGGAAGATLLAGCSGLVPKGGPFSDDDSDADTATPDEGGESGGDGGNESSSTPTAAGTPAGETDVVGLIPKQDGDQYEFLVTLNTPAGAGGTDWWQVETLDGSKLGRREFDSPRNGTNFTTSKTLAVEDDSAVVVRGHHSEVGYGGQVILLDMESGTIDVAQQGDERESFENYSF